MDRQYCPKCKCWVGGGDVDKRYHSCGCRVVPAFSEAMRLQAENERLKVELKGLKGLLGFAICPNAMNGCKDGTLYNTYGEPEQCQWCSMKEETLKG